MSSDTIASLDFAGQQIAIWFNMFNMIIGVPGGVLNLVVFLSLKTFRENTCAFYLIVVAFFNIGQLLTGALTRIFISGYGIDWTIMSTFYCKLRIYLVQSFSLITLTCLCLATLDQYLATCSSPRLQQWSNIRLVRYLTVVTIGVCCAFATLYAVFYDIIVSPTTNKLTCTSYSSIFDSYNSYFHRNVMLGFLPNLLTAIFAVMAYRNTTHIAYRTVPLVRRSLDKQLTVMLLLQVIANFFSLLCFNIVSILLPSFMASKDPLVVARMRLVQTLSFCVYYFYPACPFYIYVCVSERFRRQLMYVLFVKYFNRCIKLRITHNEVNPQEA